MVNCYDCVHSSVKGDELRCTKRSGDVSDRSNICDEFADASEYKCCEDCEHYESGAFSRWNDHGKCTLKGIRRRNDDVACSSFTEW